VCVCACVRVCVREIEREKRKTRTFRLARSRCTTPAPPRESEGQRKRKRECVRERERKRGGLLFQGDRPMTSSGRGVQHRRLFSAGGDARSHSRAWADGELTEGPGHDPNMMDAGPYQSLYQGFAPDITESLEWNLAAHPHGGLRNVD